METIKSGAVEALHELRRMSAAVCWRCEGRRWTYVRVWNGHTFEMGAGQCPSCAGTGQPERVA